MKISKARLKRLIKEELSGIDDPADAEAIRETVRNIVMEIEALAELIGPFGARIGIVRAIVALKSKKEQYVLKEELGNTQENRAAVATEFELYSELLTITDQLQGFKDNLDFAMGLTAGASKQSQISDEVYEMIRKATFMMEDARIKLAQEIGQDPAPQHMKEEEIEEVRKNPDLSPKRHKKPGEIKDDGKHADPKRARPKKMNEELTRQDKTDVKKMVKDELEKLLKKKEMKDQISELTKKILKKLYKDLSLEHPYIIDRIKV